MIERRRIYIEKDKVCICYRCKNKVFPSDNPNYKYQCFIHDEDLFGIETEFINRSEYIQRLSKKLHCSIEIAELIDQEYDAYVNKCRLKEEYPVNIKKFYKQRFIRINEDRSV